MKLYDQSSIIAQNHQIHFRFLKDLNEDIYQRILKVLSEFALGDRYSNINILSQSQQQSDPVSNWYDSVDRFIFENYVSDKIKSKIDANAKLIDVMMRDFTLVRHIAETGETITDVEGASRQTGMQEAVAPYRQLFVLQMIRYWVELIESFGIKAQNVKMEKMDIPYFIEIFGAFFNEDSYFKSRKPGTEPDDVLRIMLYIF